MPEDVYGNSLREKEISEEHGLAPDSAGFGSRLMRRFLRNRMAAVGMVIVSIVILVAIFAPFLATDDPLTQDLLKRLEPPTSEHWLGTDELGRDIFSRIVYGARVSLIIGLTGSLGGMIIGVAVGVISGYFGGWLDTIVMRFIDVMMSFPGVLLAILIVAVLGPSTSNVIVALTIWRIPTFARITRGSVLSLKEKEFIEASHAVGGSNSRIIWHHLVLNSLSPIVVYMTLSVATAILTAAGLGFLGLGVQPPTPEWGLMVSTARQYLLDAPHLIIFPGAAIFMTVLSINFIGDALRDVLDPKLEA